MRDEKDMIEINLNTSTKAAGKETNYFGNIRFAKANTRGFPYGQCEDEDASQQQKSCGKYVAFSDAKFINTRADVEKISSSIRQMYCPDCQQRLDADSVRYEKFLSCCLPLVPINYIKRHFSRKVICSKCGCNLGYWKQS